MKTTSIYLNHLRFDQRLRQSLVARFVSNPRLVFLLLFSIIIVGVASYLNLQKRLNPEIKIPIIIVSTVLPGAGPQDVESLVTIPLENSLNTITNVNTVQSTSRDNISIISIEFHSGVDTERARTDTQSAIEQVQLPQDAQRPRVQKVDFENQPVWSFALTGSDDASLSQFAQTLKKDLTDLATIDKVIVSGLEEQEILVVIDVGKIATYNINPILLSQAVKSAAQSFPAGIVNTDNAAFSLAIDPAVTSIDNIRNLQLLVNGMTLPLSSVATIVEQPKPNKPQSFFASRTTPAQKTVNFDVYKITSANIDRATKDAEKKVDELTQTYNQQFTIRTITNTGELIDEQFGELLRDFWITIILVFLVLLIFLGARQAVVSFLAVPLTFLISFIVMNLMGISLNFLSMFSLLLSLGLLVDDTIVVISAMTAYFRSEKFTPLETGLLVWRDFSVAILTTTLTTVWAFLPLLLSTGIIGEFIKAIPIVVSSTLLASLGVAMLITLPLMIIILRPEIPRRVSIFLKILLIIGLLVLYILIVPKGPILILEVLALILFLLITIQIRKTIVQKSTRYLKRRQRRSVILKQTPRYFDKGIIPFDAIEQKYKQIITRILSSQAKRRKVIAMVVVFSIFSYLLFPFGFVKNEFFPKSDQNFLYASLELPAGTNTKTASHEAVILLNQLRKTPDTDYIIANLGRSFSGIGGFSEGEASTILYSIVLPKASKRHRSSVEIAQTLRDHYATYPKGEFTITEVTGGPPAGADLQIKLFGDDLSTLSRYAEKVVIHLKSQPGVIDAKTSVRQGTSKIVFTPNDQQLAQNGIQRDVLSLYLRTFASGFMLDSLKTNTGGEEAEDITLRFGNSSQNVDKISALSLPTIQGQVPLASLGDMTLKANPTLVTRENGKRTISVTAGVIPGFSVSTLNKSLENYANRSLFLPSGYSWKTGGVNEENQKSVNSILVAMILSFLLIVITMVIQFGSFRKAIIVMLVIPLSISGVFIIFALTQTPLSFPALIGILALFGIVVKNAILIVDKINQNMKTGMRYIDAISDAATSRLEAIALTSFATIVALIPITLSDPLWRGLGGAIIAGLTFSGTIMLFFIPVIYFTWLVPNQTIRQRGVTRRIRK